MSDLSRALHTYYLLMLLGLGLREHWECSANLNLAIAALAECCTANRFIAINLDFIALDTESFVFLIDESTVFLVSERMPFYGRFFLVVLSRNGLLLSLRR